MRYSPHPSCLNPTSVLLAYWGLAIRWNLRVGMLRRLPDPLDWCCHHSPDSFPLPLVLADFQASPAGKFKMSYFAIKITSYSLGWTLFQMFLCKICLIAVLTSIALHHFPPEFIGVCGSESSAFIPTGSDFIWIAPPADSWLPVIPPADVATYDSAYLSPRSYEGAILYTSSGVLVDRHSSFCASRLLRLTMNTSLRVRFSNAPELHRAASPLKTE